VPNTLQYPLERERDLERRWSRLLQRTLMRKEHVHPRRRAVRSVTRQGVRAEAPGRSHASRLALD
jgi:hypothetical protein